MKKDKASMTVAEMMREKIRNKTQNDAFGQWGDFDDEDDFIDRLAELNNDGVKNLPVINPIKNTPIKTEAKPIVRKIIELVNNDWVKLVITAVLGLLIGTFIMLKLKWIN